MQFSRQVLYYCYFFVLKYFAPIPLTFVFSQRYWLVFVQNFYHDVMIQTFITVL